MSFGHNCIFLGAFPVWHNKISRLILYFSCFGPGNNYFSKKLLRIIFRNKDYHAQYALISRHSQKIYTHIMYKHVYECVLSCSVVSDSLRPHGLKPTRFLCSWNFPSKNTGLDCHFLLQGIFLTQELNPLVLCLPHWQADSLALHHLGRPCICIHTSITISLFILLFYVISKRDIQSSVVIYQTVNKEFPNI